jgi:DNA-binding CsgD family transcriptional regulator
VGAADGDIVRAAEWRRIRDFASGVRDRARPAVLAVQGEAGAGKSTLWAAGVKAATDVGCRLLRTEPSASEADLPFAGLSDLLAGVLPDVGAGIPAPQREALEIALLLRPAGDQPPTAHAVGLAVLTALRSCVAAGPALVAIDDVQWLDAASLEALAFAVRRITAGPLSLLLAARTQAPADPLTAGEPAPPSGWRELLAAVPTAEEIALVPLDMWQIQNLLPSTVSAAQARMVARQSRGNPFWAREISASLSSSDVPVPPLAKAALTERLSRSLSPPAATALAVVAAAGRITTSDALAVLDDLADPAAAVDAAVLAGVVVETEGRIAPSHPLIGAAAVESLPPGRRTRIYQRLATASANPERYAHFAALAASPGPDPAVADALDAAAEAAHARAANAAAGQFAAQAVIFTAESDDDALVRRRIRAAELLALAGDITSSLGHLERLDTDRLATADLERALPLLLDATEQVRGAAAGMAVVEQAVAAAGTGTEPRRRALVLSLASDVALGMPGYRRAAVEAIACAEEAGPDASRALHRALLNLVRSKVAAGEGLDTGLLDRAGGLEVSHPVARLWDAADQCRAWSRYVEDLDTARTVLGRSIERARDTGEEIALWAFMAYLASTEAMAGDYAAAAAALDQADAAAVWYDWTPSPWHIEPRCKLLIAGGKLDEAFQLAAEHLPDEEFRSVSARFMGAGLRGEVSLWRGDAAAAVPYLERAVWCAEELGWADPGIRYRLDHLLAEAYVTTGRLDDARRISAWLRGIGMRQDRPVHAGDADRIDALLAAADGDLDLAAARAEAAVQAHRLSPLRLEPARSLLVLGRIERRRKARSQSRRALQAAFDLAAGLNHRALMAEIERELPVAAAVRSAGSQLTAAEQRVADLIVSGATNRDAAAALFVSVRTVETHVASVYRKLGVRTRTELVRALSAQQSSGYGPPVR